MSEENEVVQDLPVGDLNFILGQKTDPNKWVQIPEWNCKVQIKALTKAEQIRLRKTSSVRGQVDETKLEMNMLVASLVQPRLTVDQVDTLFSDADSRGLNRLVNAVIRHSGLDENYAEEAEADFQE